jgi:hypothetical protein
MKARTLAWGVVLGLATSTRALLAQEATCDGPIVGRYSAPAECSGAEIFSASVKAELAGRRIACAQHPVSVDISREPHGYSARATSTGSRGEPLVLTVEAGSCEEVADMAATVVALAQTDSQPTTQVDLPQARAVPVPREAPAPLSSSSPSPPRTVDFAFSAGYGAFTAGPAEPVVRTMTQQFTFNPAQGARIAFEASHAWRWWRHSVGVSAGYYRQSFDTRSLPAGTGVGPTGAPVDVNDRDVLQATIDACPLHVEYSVLAFVPCATLSMIQSRGNSGNTPGLETGMGVSTRLRARFAGPFFVEALGAAVGRVSSYDPTSRDVRLFYALSLGSSIR